MTTVATELTLPSTTDRVVLAIQDTINHFQWKVLELSTSRVRIDLGKLQPMQSVNFPKMTVEIVDLIESTKLLLSVSMIGPGNKKALTGSMGQFVNSVSLRVQTNSIAINPTVAIGEGQGGPSSGGNERLSLLIQLQALRQSGALTEAEFETEKQRILNQP